MKMNMMKQFTAFTTSFILLLCYLARPAALYLDPAHTKATYHRSSDLGRMFLFTIPDNFPSWGSPMASVCLTTFFENSVKVSLVVPDDVFNQEPSYSELIGYTKFNSPKWIYLGANKGTWKHNMMAQTGHVIKITAEYDIGVLVLFQSNNIINDMFILPPTSAYSTRYLINFPAQVKMRAFMIIITIYDNTLFTIIFRLEYSVPLNQNALSFTRIDWDPKDVDQYLGALIESSKPLLVLVAMDPTFSFMVMPSVSSVAKSFVMINMKVTKVNAKFYVTVLPLSRNNSYKMNTLSESGISTFYVYSGHHLEIPLNNTQTSMFYLNSTIPVSLIVYCDLKSFNSLNFGLVMIPEHSWPSFAYFLKPNWMVSKRARFGIHLIVRRTKIKGLMVNGKALSTLKWAGYSLSLYDLRTKYLDKKTASLLIVQKDPRYTFIAYVSISLPDHGYVSVINLRRIHYLPTRLHGQIKCVKQRTAMLPGDDIDNDCDNKFDEEIWNGKDDDSDKLIDEDLMLEPANGSWGPWQPWHCEGQWKCLGTLAKAEWRRYRSCANSPGINGHNFCVGSSLQKKDSANINQCQANCDINDTNYCPLGVFSWNCDIKCSKGCWMDVCYKPNGYCLACKTQYTDMPFCEQENYKLIWTTVLHDFMSIQSNNKNNKNNNNISLYASSVAIIVITFLLIGAGCFLARKQAPCNQHASVFKRNAVNAGQ